MYTKSLHTVLKRRGKDQEWRFGTESRIYVFRMQY